MGFFEIFAGVLAALYGLVHSFGLAIILLTLVVRIILLPLSIKQTRSMREMQRIQPEIKKLQQKYKGNKQKLNEEMMALYKEHGVNPLGGCLPLVMQFPVFIALYRVVRTPLAYMGYTLPQGSTTTSLSAYQPNKDLSGIMNTLQSSDLADQLHHHAQSAFSFLGLFHLDCTPIEVFHQTTAAPSYCVSSNFLVWVPYVLLILLMGATTFWQQRQLQGSRQVGEQTAQQKQMQTMTRIMPGVLMFFSLQFPTGLTFYWLTSNVWTVFQQRKVLGPMIAAEHEKAPPKKVATAQLTADESNSKQPAKNGKKTSTKGSTSQNQRNRTTKTSANKQGGKAKQPSTTAKKKRK
jgi:YidC/Oxa1 family membrane protein insertase